LRFSIFAATVALALPTTRRNRTSGVLPMHCVMSSKMRPRPACEEVVPAAMNAPLRTRNPSGIGEGPGFVTLADCTQSGAMRHWPEEIRSAFLANARTRNDRIFFLPRTLLLV